MRVLLWAGAYAPAVGGVETIVQGLGESLVRRGDAVAVFAPSGSEAESHAEQAGVEVHWLPFQATLASRDPARIQLLGSVVSDRAETFAPDLIHAHGLHPSLYFLLRSARSLGVPLVVTLHGWSEVPLGPEAIVARILHLARRVTGVSGYTVASLLARLPDLAPKTVRIYNGCVDREPPPRPLRASPPHLVCLGRLVELKGFDCVVRALPAVLRRWPEARLTLVGEGPERSPLERLAAELGVSDRVELLGYVSEADKIVVLDDASVVVSPSRPFDPRRSWSGEGLNLASVEAALRARPVVATRGHGLEEAVVDGRTGLLVESGDQVALERALARVIEDETWARALGAAARRRALDVFDWDRQVQRYRSLYAEVLEEQQP